MKIEDIVILIGVIVIMFGFIMMIIETNPNVNLDQEKQQSYQAGFTAGWDGGYQTGLREGLLNN